MKILTILGTRPEIIRLSRIIPKLDECCRHVVVHTGQNFDRLLNQIFFDQLGLRTPEYFLDARGTFAEQAGIILPKLEKILIEEKPDRFLVLGDTNSSLGAFVSKRLGIPVFHMEAGNRCYDDRVPEEVNRRIIDHSSDILLPYTGRSRLNLLAEGIPGERIFVTGNPIYEVISHSRREIEASSSLENLGVSAGDYFLVTMHREENVDVPERLSSLLGALSLISEEYGKDIIVSTHPRTRRRLTDRGEGVPAGKVRFLDPFGFFDFIQLEKNALCVLSDSGTVQEECAILGKPCVILRDATERPEIIEAGAGILSGVEPDRVLDCVRLLLRRRGSWNTPPEYMAANVSDTVVSIMMGELLQYSRRKDAR